MIQAKAYPEFEVSLTAPIGVNFIFPYASGETGKVIQEKHHSIDYSDIENSFLPNLGLLMQIGGSFDLKNETGITSISLLADLGYYLQSFGSTFENRYDDNLGITEEAIFFDTLDLGTTIKINIEMPNMSRQKPFSVGLGGGVRIPFSATKYTLLPNGEKIKEELSHLDIKEIFKNAYMPYIKLTVDTYFYVSESFALTVGLYTSYSFGIQYDIDKLNAINSTTAYPLKLTKYGYSSYDIGISLGAYFGRPNPKLNK